MRIAIPSQDDRGMESYIAEHFGRAKYYTFVDVGLEERRVLGHEVVELPFESHEPGDIPIFIREHEGELIMAQGMGVKAQEFFNYMGIKVLTGVSGKIGDVVDLFLQGRIHEIIEKNFREE